MHFNSREFEAYVQALIDKTGVPGLGVGIAKDGQMLYFRGFGVADIEKGLPVTPDTVFGLASVTKSFTALAINQLAESGRLALHEPVKRYLPEFQLPQPGAAERVTLHNFLSHTSGIPPMPSLTHANNGSIPLDEKGRLGERPKVPEGEPVIVDNKDLLRYIASHKFELLGDPGERVSYSNDCFSLLGEVIERVSGQTYEQYLKENVWEPTGMNRTFVDVTKVTSLDAQGLYFKDKEGHLQKALWKHRDVFVSSGSVKSSVADLLKYVRMYMDGGKASPGAGGSQVANRATVGRMTAPYYPVGPGTYYAYGLTVRPNYAPGYTLVNHGGNIVGVASYIGFIPEAGVGIVVLSNLSGFPAAKVWFAAANLILGLPIEHQASRLQPVDLSEEQLQRFAGRYVSGEGASISLDVKEGKMYASMGEKQLSAYSVGDDAVAIEEDGDQTVLRILFDALGKAWALRLGLRIVPRAE